MSSSQNAVEDLIDSGYEHGFITNIKSCGKCYFRDPIYSPLFFFEVGHWDKDIKILGQFSVILPKNFHNPIRSRSLSNQSS